MTLVWLGAALTFDSRRQSGVLLAHYTPAHTPHNRFAQLHFADLERALAGGALDWRRVLDDAGAADAHAVLYLAGEAPCADAFMVDRRAVLFTSVIEEEHKSWGKDTYLSVELHNPFSIWYLQESVPYANPAKPRGGNRAGGGGCCGGGGGGRGRLGGGGGGAEGRSVTFHPGLEDWARGNGQGKEGRDDSSGLWNKLTARARPPPSPVNTPLSSVAPGVVLLDSYPAPQGRRVAGVLMRRLPCVHSRCRTRRCQTRCGTRTRPIGPRRRRQPWAAARWGSRSMCERAQATACCTRTGAH